MKKKLFKRKWVKVLVIVLIVLLVLLLASFLFSRSRRPEIENNNEEFSYIRTVTLSYDSLNETIVASGTIESQTTSTISASINNATISKIYYSIGDDVEEGDVIIELDTTNLNKQIEKTSTKINEQEESLQDKYNSAYDTYSSAYSAYSTAENSNNDAKTKFEQAKEAIESLVEKYNTAKTEYDEAVNNCLNSGGCNFNEETPEKEKKDALEKAENDLKLAKEVNDYDALEKTYNSTQETLSKTSQTLQQAKSSLNQAEDELYKGVDTESLDELNDTVSDYKLKAKSSGKITSLSAVLGSNANGTLATIQDTKKLKINVTVDEYDILKLELGMKAQIETDASDMVYEGVVSQISPVASGSFGSTGFDVEIEVTSENVDNLLIGMSAEVTIIVSSTSNTFFVPMDAIEEKTDGTKIIYVQNDQGEFEEMEVTTGNNNGYYIEIFSEELKTGLKVRASANAQEAEVKVSEEEMSNMPGGFGFDFGGAGGGNSFPQMGGNSGGGMPQGNRPSGGMPGGF